MKILLTLLVIGLLPMVVTAQETIGFKYGQVTYRDLDATTYPADTSANAYVIYEFGKTMFDYDNINELIIDYHVKIKILRQEGLSQANIEIPLYKSNTREETIRDIYASSFNTVNGKIVETKLESRSIFTEKNGKYYNFTKFAIPNAKVGSVIEYQYRMRSPFIFNFRTWDFQSDIPKVVSEYHTIIPANFTFNVTLRGYLNLANHDSEIAAECFRVSGGTADCAISKYAMKDIPAFKDEEFMTAKANFLSSIRYELQQVKDFNGAINKYTKEWKDADQEFRNSADFGQQLKRGENVVEDKVKSITLGENDPLTKAKLIYDFVKFHYIWDEVYGLFTEYGIKKAFEEKKGNIADINLTLIVALRSAGFSVDPVALGTRGHGRPVELHPVMSDFNYVIAKLDLDGKTYLLDAVDDYLPFGSISLRCYNGIGRVLNSEGSYWMDIKPAERDRSATMISLSIADNGEMTGTITETYFGYAAVRQRKEMAEFQDEKSYLEKQKASNHFFTITSYERTGVDDLSKPVVEKFGVQLTAFDPGAQHFLFNPFLVGRTETNPFKTDTRMFPVDFAVPLDRSITIVVDFPESFEVTSMPDKVGLAIPKAGGRYIFGAQVMGNKLTMNNVLGIARPVFAPEEYPYLKEIYSKMLQAQGADVIFKKKQ
ncbi:MAG: transglutaminase domain-containing protein [Bacteroidota bacterium]